jgi:DNA-directed RNA polymerase specialized sigma24 family protein
MTRSLESGARLRIALRGYPHHLDPETIAFLRSLPYRWRRAVELYYGCGMTQEQAGRELCVSRHTVGRDLDRVAELFG